MSNTTIKLDHATQLALPLAEVEAPAQFRFVFRPIDGDEEWLLARWVRAEIIDDEHSVYELILRPENAEPERIFLMENYYEVPSTQQELQEFRWGALEESFQELFGWEHDLQYQFQRLARFEIVEENGEQIILECFDNISGRLYRAGEPGRDYIEGNYPWEQTYNNATEFYWNCPDDDTEKREFAYRRCMRFLRLNTYNFQQRIRSLWNDSDSGIRWALRWHYLSQEERERLAFECKNGTWNELKQLVTFALQLRLGREKELGFPYYRWNFNPFAYRPALYHAVFGCKALDKQDGSYHDISSPLKEDKNFSDWHTILTRHFQAINLGDGGRYNIEHPSGLPKYYLMSLIESSVESLIYVSPPSQHEIIEANLQLREWAKIHLAPDEIEKLFP